jgi:hypothetical protein
MNIFNYSAKGLQIHFMPQPLKLPVAGALRINIPAFLEAGYISPHRNHILK